MLSCDFLLEISLLNSILHVAVWKSISLLFRTIQTPFLSQSIENFLRQEFSVVNNHETLSQKLDGIRSKRIENNVNKLKTTIYLREKNCERNDAISRIKNPVAKKRYEEFVEWVEKMFWIEK